MGAVRGELGGDSACWWPFIGLKGLTREASRQGRDEKMILKRGGITEVEWDSMNDALKGLGRRQLALKLWLAATAKEARATDTCT